MKTILAITVSLLLSLVTCNVAVLGETGRIALPRSIGTHLTSRKLKLLSVQAYNRAVMQYEQNSLVPAAENFALALQYDPDLKAAEAPLGQALMLTGQHEAALPHLQEAFRLDPSNSTVSCQLALSASRTGRYDLALTAFKRYLQLEPCGIYVSEAKRSIEIIENSFAREARVNGFAAGYVDGAKVSDYVADFGKAPRCWPKRQRSLRVFVADGFRIANFDQHHYQILLEAFGEWTNISAGRITFELVQDAKQADICCSWTADANAFKSEAELGNTEVTYNSSLQIEHAAVVLLTGASAPSSMQQWRRARSVALHEIGHALGLQHSKHPWDIMYPQVAPPGLEFEPSESDRKTLLAIYN